MDLIPTKKIAIPFLAALFIVAGTFWVSDFKKAPRKTTVNDNLVYIKTENPNNQNDQEKIGQLLRSAVSQTATENFGKIAAFSKNDLKIIENDSREGIENYAALLLAILEKYSDPEKKSLIGAIVDFDKTGNVALLNKLEEASNRTLDTVSRLKETQVPLIATNMHLDLMNQLLASSFFIENMRMVSENKNVGLTATKEYMLKMYDVYQALQNINKFLGQQDIKLEPKTAIFLDLVTQ